MFAPAGLAEIGGIWPIGASLAVAATGRALRAGRRRSALNEALHELRRPLQALALAAPGGAHGVESGLEGSLQMAAVALQRLEREINGVAAAPATATFAARPVLEAAIARWRGRAALAGAGLELEWRAGGAALSGDRSEIGQALDNLIVNAIEHGGPRIAVEAVAERGSLVVSVRDSGRASRPPSRGESPAELIARLTGRSRHGHGLRVVRRTAGAHGGEFSLRSARGGTEAVLELPLLGGAGVA